MKRGRPRKDESLDDHLLVAASRKGARSSSRVGAKQGDGGQAVTQLLKERVQEMKEKRVQALQDDNFFGVPLPNDDDDDDNFQPEQEEEFFATAAKKKKGKGPKKAPKKTSHLRPALVPKSLRLIEEAGDAEEFVALSFPGSQLPHRRFCCVCGLLACYRCKTCAQCFCCIKCDEAHKEMRCLKFTR